MAPSFIEQVQAAGEPQFKEMFVRVDRHLALADTGVTVCAKPSAGSTATEDSVALTFPTYSDTGTGTADFVLNATAANYTVTTTNLPQDPEPDTPVTGYNTNGAQAWPGITTATSVSGKTVTFDSGDLTPGTLYCFNISGVNTFKMASGPTSGTGANGGAITATRILGAKLQTFDSTPAVINSTNWATSVTSRDTITYSAVVPPNFDLTLDGNVDAFTANLDRTTVGNTSGRTIDVSTNAVGGWVVWVKSQYAGLYSTTSNYKINTTGTVNGTPQALTAGTEGYGIIASYDPATEDAVAGCNMKYDDEYHGSLSGGTTVGALSQTFQTLMSCTRPAAVNGTRDAGTSDGDRFHVTAYATIRGGTPAGSDYTDVVTIVGAGSF